MEEVNKYLLQYMFYNGILKYDEGDNLIRYFASKIKESPKSIKTVIQEINENISPHLFCLEVKKCEITGEDMCVLINKCRDDSSMSANHTAAELELFDSILTSIMTSDAKYISHIISLNLTSHMKANITKDQAQELIDSWIVNGYFVKENGLIYLGPRTISEFKMYLKNQFSGRITNCKLCTDVVYYGKICSQCSDVFHCHCISKHLSKIQKCPKCKQPWQESAGRTYEDEESDIDDSMDAD